MALKLLVVIEEFAQKEHNLEEWESTAKEAKVSRAMVLNRRPARIRQLLREALNRRIII
jgi:hypothetical protein